MSIYYTLYLATVQRPGANRQTCSCCLTHTYPFPLPSAASIFLHNRKTFRGLRPFVMMTQTRPVKPRVFILLNRIFLRTQRSLQTQHNRPNKELPRAPFCRPCRNESQNESAGTWTLHLTERLQTMCLINV